MLASTKYPNNSRVVIGTPTIFPDDVVLLCDTTAAPVIINLQTIPAGFWSTAWKLYIVDNSNNATVNNITINAPAGYTVNGAASFILDDNGETCIVRVTGDTEFILTTSQPGSGGGLVDTASNVGAGVDVFKQKVGTDLEFRTIIGAGGIVATQNADDITLTGGGGEANTASNIGIGTGNVFANKVGVDFEFRTLLSPGDDLTITTLANEVQFLNSASTPETTTIAALLALLAAGTVRPGKAYLISDAGGTNDGAIIHACANDSMSIFGCGRFLNADYQGVGNYTGLAAFVGPPLGIWDPALAVVVGNVVIWDNAHWISITGVNTLTEPPADAVNWGPIVPATDSGFIYATDWIIFDVQANEVRQRRDLLLNSVDYNLASSGIDTIDGFPWGNDKVFGNKIEGSSRTDGFRNSKATISNNVFQGGAIITDRGPATSFITNNLLAGNEAFNSGIIECQTNLTGSFLGNEVFESRIIIRTINGPAGCLISNNSLYNSSKIEIPGIIENGSQISMNTLNASAEINIDAGVTATAINIISNSISDKSSINLKLAISPNYTTLNMSACDISSTQICDLDDVIYNNEVSNHAYSTFEAELDFSDPAIWQVAPANILTIPAGKEFVGRFITINSFGETVQHIVGMFEGRNTEFMPGTTPVGNVLRFSATPVATPALATDIVETQQNQGPATTANLHGAFGADYFVTQARGNPIGSGTYYVFWIGTNILV